MIAISSTIRASAALLTAVRSACAAVSVAISESDAAVLCLDCPPLYRPEGSSEAATTSVIAAPQCRAAAKAKQGPIRRKLSLKDCERFTTARRTFIQSIPSICASNGAWFSVRQIVVRSPGSTVTFGKDAYNASPSGEAFNYPQTLLRPLHPARCR